MNANGESIAKQLRENRSARIVLKWGDGRGKEAGGAYAFRLGIGELRELQENCRVPIVEQMDRFTQRKIGIDDIREPIRLGLIGAGLDHDRARYLVEKYVDDRPLMENAQVAHLIIIAAVVGAPNDTVEGAPEPGKETAAEQNPSASPPSTPPPP